MQKPTTKPSPSKPAEVMSSSEVRNYFGKEILDEVTTGIDDTPKYLAKDFKGALLTDERVVIYTSAEFRKGTKADYYVFRNPLGNRALVYPADVVLETGIEGLVDQEILDKAAAGQYN